MWNRSPSSNLSSKGVAAPATATAWHSFQNRGGTCICVQKVVRVSEVGISCSACSRNKQVDNKQTFLEAAHLWQLLGVEKRKAKHACPYPCYDKGLLGSCVPTQRWWFRQAIFLIVFASFTTAWCCDPSFSCVAPCMQAHRRDTLLSLVPICSQCWLCTVTQHVDWMMQPLTCFFE